MCQTQLHTRALLAIEYGLTARTRSASGYFPCYLSHFSSAPPWWSCISPEEEVGHNPKPPTTIPVASSSELVQGRKQNCAHQSL